jgi:ribosomal protein L37AE/L43A
MNNVSTEDFLRQLDSMGNMTHDNMKNAETGAIVRIACRECEGFETHTKLKNGKWKCLNCGAEDIEFE